MAVFSLNYTNTSSCMDVNNDFNTDKSMNINNLLYKDNDSKIKRFRNNHGTKYYKYEKNNRKNYNEQYNNTDEIINENLGNNINNAGMNSMINNFFNMESENNNIKLYNEEEYNERPFGNIDLNETGYGNPIFHMFASQDIEDIKKTEYEQRNGNKFTKDAYRYKNALLYKCSRSAQLKEDNHEYILEHISDNNIEELILNIIVDDGNMSDNSTDEEEYNMLN